MATTADLSPEVLMQLKRTLGPMTHEPIPVDGIGEVSAPRPLLTPPEEYKRTDIGMAMKQIADTLSQIQGHNLDFRKETFDDHTDRLIEEQKMHQNAIAEAERKRKTAGFWGFLKKVFCIIASALSVVIGGILCAVGGPIGIAGGSALIAGGVMSLTSQVLSDQGVSPKATGAVALTGSILGLIGSVASIATLAKNLPALISTIVTGVVNVGEGVTKIGTSISMHKVHKEQARVSDHRGKVSLSKEDLEWVTQDLKRSVKKVSRDHTVLAHIATEHNQLANRMVRFREGVAG
ncbi:MAG: hypothetical protein MRY21_08150 [Simkaniaceae bacterium]|nr:hypothetical protein [Simkaniaceae bacterium]